MHLSLNEKANLDSLVNFFGGRSWLIVAWKKDPLHRRMVRKGLVRWGRSRNGLCENIATAKGIAVAKRFKKDWSEIWGDLHADEIAEAMGQ